MAQDTPLGYVYTNYEHEFYRTEVKHHHTIRREPNTTYVDEFAAQHLRDLQPELYRQYIQGHSRSYYNVDRHMEALMQYGTPDIPITNLNEIIYEDCVNEARLRLSSLPRVKAIKVENELDLVPYKPSSAAGYNFNGAKGLIGGANHKRAIKLAKAMLHDVMERGEDGLREAIFNSVPDVGYTRTQLTDLTEKTKVRNVWGRAFHYILLEGTTAAPLIAMFSKHKSFYHIGRDPVYSVPEALQEAAQDRNWLYAIDWKQFDATVSRFEIKTAFRLIYEMIDFEGSLMTELAFEICKQLFIHKKIAAPDGYVYWAHKGIPSGSYFTSIIGSIVNFLRIQYLWRVIKGHGPSVIFTQGDDSLSGDPDFIPPEAYDHAARAVGWSFNPEKTEYSTIPQGVSFLGRTCLGGLNQRSILKCLRLLIYPEYPVTSGSISAYRALSIFKDCGQTCEELQKIAERLKRRYGVAKEEEVPDHFKRYIM